MNREIKFRVWSKAKNTWVHNMMLLACIDGLPFAHFVEVNENKSVIHHIVNASGLDVVIQQYTGLKDKNGVEIYEGDIVWLDYSGRRVDEKDHNQFEVIFYRGAFQLNPIKLSKPQGFGVGGGNFAFSHMVEIIGHNKDDEPIYQYKLPPPQPISQFNICVVMGNIFENSELLKA